MLRKALMILALVLPLVVVADKHDPEPECYPCPGNVAVR